MLYPTHPKKTQVPLDDAKPSGVAVFVGTSMADKCLTGLQLIERLKRIPQF